MLQDHGWLSAMFIILPANSRGTTHLPLRGRSSWAGGLQQEGGKSSKLSLLRIAAHRSVFLRRNSNLRATDRLTGEDKELISAFSEFFQAMVVRLL